MYLDHSIHAVKSGTRKGSGYKSSGYKYYGNGNGGGGGGSRLPVWVIVVIVVSVLWACLYLALFFHFFRKCMPFLTSTQFPSRSFANTQKTTSPLTLSNDGV